MNNPLKRLFATRRMNATATSYIGAKELVGGIALAALFGVTGYGWSAQLGPAREKVVAAQAEYKKLQTEAEALRANQQQRERQAELLKTAIEKKEDFEQAHLRTDIRTARLDLIDEVNEMTRKHTVQIDGGIEFNSDDVELPILPGEAPTASSSASDKPKTVFYPSLTARFKITGYYKNARQFIQTLEHSKQFLVVKLTEIQTSQDAGRQSGANVSSTGTDTVTVGIEATLFARPVAGS